MEPSRPAALARAIAPLNERSELPVQIILHAHESGLLVDPRNREIIAEHLVASDLIVISHVMLDEEVTLLASLVEQHSRPDATVVAISSAAPLMRLTHVGEFRMSGRSRETSEPRNKSSRLRSLLKKFTGDRNIAPYLKDLMILAPRLLRFLPGKMSDLRSYIESYLYCIEGSDQNMRALFLMLADRYHEPLRGKLAGNYKDPVIYPSEGIYHPDAPSIFNSRDEYLHW
jgi:magnesium chelatase subunit H